MIMTTSTYAAMLGIIYVLLSLNVVRCRFKYKVSLGDGGDNNMERAMRTHGNFIEYTPIFLILLSMAEINGAGAFYIHAIGSTFLAGRIAHIYGLAFHPKGEVNLYRKGGMILTLLSILTASAILMLQYIT